MNKSQSLGMEALALKALDHLFRAIDRIAGYWMSDISHVYPNLVGPTCFQPQLQLGKTAKILYNLKVGNRFFAISLCDRHLLAIHWMPPNGSDHLTLFFFHVAVDHGRVNTGKGMIFYLLGQRKMSKVVFCHHEQPTGVLIDTVNDTGTHNTTNAR